jgi:hypothetical protein
MLSLRLKPLHTIGLKQCCGFHTALGEVFDLASREKPRLQRQFTFFVHRLIWQWQCEAQALASLTLGGSVYVLAF